MAVNHGLAFEAMIEKQNVRYRAAGLAVITKRPTPMVIIKPSRSGFLCRFDSKRSTVDFDGVYRGRPIMFEAKSVADDKKNLGFDKIKDHQIQYIYECMSQGAVCFLIVYFVKMDKIYLLSGERLVEYADRAKQGGRKSISIEEFETYAYTTNIDYLKVVDEIFYN